MDKMKYNYYLQLFRDYGEGEGALEKIQEIAKNKDLGLIRTIPLGDGPVKGFVAYSAKREGYEVAISVERYINEKEESKEKIDFQGTGYRRDNDLIQKILGELD